MKIECQAKELRSALELGRRVPPKRDGRRMSEFVTIEALSGRLLMSASDGEIVVRRDIEGDVLEEGTALLPAKRALAFMRGEKVKVGVSVVNAEQVLMTGVNGGSAELRIWQPGQESCTSCVDWGKANIDLGADFVRRLGWVQTMMAKEDSRPVLGNVLLRLSEKGLDMVAADGFRLIRISDTKVSLEGERELLIPRKACMLISKYMTGSVRMGFHAGEADGVVWFEDDKTKIVSSMMRAKFPRYEVLFQTQEPSWRFTVSSPMLEARLQQFDPDDCIVRFWQAGNFLRATMASGDDKFSTLIPVKVDVNEDGKIGMNKYFVMDAIRGFAEVTFEVTSSASPMKVYGDVEGAEVMIMPMYLEW